MVMIITNDVATVSNQASPTGLTSNKLELTDRELAVLEIENKRWKYPALKEKVIREQLDLNATRYYQILNSLLTHPGALSTNPGLINRLRNALPATSIIG